MRGINYTTIIFAAITILLAISVSLTIWELHRSSQVKQTPDVNVSFSLGVPDIRPAEDNQEFNARSALLWDFEQQSIKFEQNGFDRAPIASITKLMTAMVALDYGFDMEAETSIELNEYVIGSRLLLHPGEKVTMRDLFNASLLGSANNATLAFVRSTGIAENEFVHSMNRKAVTLGLEQTLFTDVTGLEKTNVSTAYEVAKMAEYAFANYPEIAEATQQFEYRFVVKNSDREHIIRNPNKIISLDQQPFLGSKTGYLYEAGYCLVVRGKGDTASKIAVILGSTSEPQQFSDIMRLLGRPVP